MAKDAKMYYLADDIQKIQVKTNMYINEYGPAGAFHLCREIVQNNFDECLDEDSPGKTITLSYDIETDIFRAEDDGRGFSEKDFPLNIFCTTLQSGSKFFRNSGAKTAGEFGVGLSVVNALSDYFVINSYRTVEKTHHVLEYSEGVCKCDEIKVNKDKRHGTSISFRTSRKYMGDDCTLPIDDVVTWIDSLFYLDSDRLREKNITCTLDIYKGMKLKKTYKFVPRDFSELLEKVRPASVKKKQMTPICHFAGETSFNENSKALITNEDGTTQVSQKLVERSIHMDVAFQYCTSADVNDAATYDTYCNYTNTIENGTHLDAFEEAYCRFIQNSVNSSMSESQKNKLQIKWDDIRTNLFCVLNLSTDAAVGFVGNAKTSIDSKHLLPYMKEIITDGLTAYFKKNQDQLNTIIKVVKLNAKARIEATKAKVATQTERINTLSEHSMSNYIRCNNTGKKWKELCLVEGNSASGSVRNGRDADTTAVYLFRGVVMNAEKASLAEVMANTEYKNLVTVMRCGIGDKFDLSKLYFNRINIMTDSDIDGAGISAGMLSFFYKYFRPIIEAGMLYKIYAPLYRIDDKDHPFVINKGEMVELYQKEVVKVYKIKPEGYGSYLSKDELYEFLMDTYDYRTNLEMAAKSSGKINKFFIEIIIAYLTLFGIVEDPNNYKDLYETFNNQKFITKFMNIIQKKYKEVKCDNDCRIFGVTEGKTSLVKINQRFFKKTADLIPVYKKYGYKLTVSEKGKDPVEMSIGEFLDITMKLYPTILSRFKGLGEIDGKQLHDTTLDINHRVSIQYTVEDVERELAIFEMTHGNSKQNALDRKEMMKRYKIKREDLDN